jgi:hypothetical protein
LVVRPCMEISQTTSSSPTFLQPWTTFWDSLNHDFCVGLFVLWFCFRCLVWWVVGSGCDVFASVPWSVFLCRPLCSIFYFWYLVSWFCYRLSSLVSYIVSQLSLFSIVSTGTSVISMTFNH